MSIANLSHFSEIGNEFLHVSYSLPKHEYFQVIPCSHALRNQSPSGRFGGELLLRITHVKHAVFEEREVRFVRRNHHPVVLEFVAYLALQLLDNGSPFQILKK